MSSNINTFAHSLARNLVCACVCLPSSSGLLPRDKDRERSRRVSNTEFNPNKLCKTSHDDHIS